MFRWDYRWMDYPGMGRDVRHPYDQSLMTYKGHLVLRTLIRCYFSPLARWALNPPIPTLKLRLDPCVCDQSLKHPIQIRSMQVTMMIENLGCWGDCVFILFFLFNLFLCDATVFKYDQVNKFVHTQESSKRCREEHVRKYDIPYSLMMLHGCSTGQKYIYTGSHDGCVYIFDMVKSLSLAFPLLPILSVCQTNMVFIC
jgi:hypothetical protein